MLREFLLAFAEAPEVVGNCFLVPGRDRLVFRGTDLPRRLVVCIVAQLEFQFVDPAEHLGVELLDHYRIAGKSAWIQTLHFAG